MPVYECIWCLFVLRIYTGLGVEECEKIAAAYNNDLGSALNRGLAYASVPLTRLIEGNWYVSCVHTRFGVYVFKLYSGENIYDNKTAWEIRNELNKMVNSYSLDSEKILDIVMENKVHIHSYVSLSYEMHTFGIYLSNKINKFIYKGIAITMVESYTCEKTKLITLSRLLSQQYFYVLTNDFKFEFKWALTNVMLLSSMHNKDKTSIDMINGFSKVNNCIVDVQCVIVSI